jgi:bifunctional non-homologous end joining protein LigD
MREPLMSEVHVEVAGRTFKLSNLDKVLYPMTGTTKGEIINYYAQIAEVMLRHLAGRPVTRIRWPNGVQKASFFEKNAPAGTPSWVRIAHVPTTGSRTADGSNRWGSETSSDFLDYPIVDELATLVWLANLAALELHVHQWRVDDVGVALSPDRLVVDLDPGDGAGLQACCGVALLVRDALGDRGLSARAVTSGSKGLHLYADLAGSLLQGQDSGVVSLAVKEMAEELQKAHPDRVTAVMTKTRREGRTFFDWSQNAGAKTTIAPYSLRGKERPTVATPVTWAEVEAGADDELALEQFSFEQVLERVADFGDLF